MRQALRVGCCKTRSEFITELWVWALAYMRHHLGIRFSKTRSEKSAGPSGHTAVWYFLPILSSCHSVPFWSCRSCLLAYCGVLISVFQFSGLPAICLLVASGPRRLVITSKWAYELSPGTPSQIPYLQHISHICHIWPPLRVIWSPWEQKVSQLTSIRGLNGANLTSRIYSKLILRQKCKTSRNLIIYYVLWRSAISKNTFYDLWALKSGLK